MQTGGRLVIKPTRKQIEGGFLGTLASIGIPIAIELVSKMFGKGLQVDKRPPPPPPPNPYSMFIFLNLEENFQCIHHHFMVTGDETIGMGKKRQEKGKRLEREKKRSGVVIRKKQSIQRDPNSWKHFVNKPLSNFDLRKMD